MRQLIASCISADPDARPNITAVYKVALEMNQLMMKDGGISPLKINSDYNSRRLSFHLNK